MTIDEREVLVGESVRALRLRANQTQVEVAERAGVSLSALKNLELGRGSTLGTMARVLRALGRESWFDEIVPSRPATVNPMALLRERQSAAKAPRQRAGRVRRAVPPG